MDDTVLKLLEELEQVVDEGRSSPFSNKVQVDKDEIFEIIDEIKMKLPNEIKQSKWVIEERNKILVDAQKEADEMLKEAEVRLGKLVEEHAVTKKAYEQAAEVMDATKTSTPAPAARAAPMMRRQSSCPMYGICWTAPV